MIFEPILCQGQTASVCSIHVCVFVYSVGANHDVNETGCRTDDQFVMAVNPRELTESNFDNPFRFSPCSIDDFRGYINKLNEFVQRFIVLRCALEILN